MSKMSKKTTTKKSSVGKKDIPWYQFWKKDLTDEEYRKGLSKATNAFLLFIITCLVIYSLNLGYKWYVDLLIILGVCGAILSSYLAGEQKWQRVRFWYTVFCLAIIAIGYLDLLEENRVKAIAKPANAIAPAAAKGQSAKLVEPAKKEESPRGSKVIQKVYNYIVDGKKSKSPKTKTIEKQSHDFNKKGDLWGPRFTFKIGDPIIIKISNNPVIYKRGGPGKKDRDLDPGTYNEIWKWGEVPIFEALSDKYAHVTVIKTISN